MSGVSVVNYILSHAAGVTALVPAARIFSGPVALPATLPLVIIQQIDAAEDEDVQMAGSRFIRERVQVTVYAATYLEKRPILQAVRDACVGQRGTVDSVKLDGIMPAGVGPDLDDPGQTLYEQSTDLLVKWLT